MTHSDRALLQNIGKVIRWYRRKRKFPQALLSSKLHVSQAALSRYERGKTNMPVLTLKWIADICDFTMDEYFIEITTPSDMYKAVIGDVSERKQTEEDRAFNEFMTLPENQSKMRILYYASKMSSLVPDTARDQLVDSVQKSIIHQTRDNLSIKRIRAYMEGVYNIYNKKR